MGELQIKINMGLVHRNLCTGRGSHLAITGVCLPKIETDGDLLLELYAPHGVKENGERGGFSQNLYINK